MAVATERWVTPLLNDALGPCFDPVGGVLAAIPEWWSRRARNAGLVGEWLDWRRALPEPPVPLSWQPLQHLFDSSAEDMSAAYLAACDPAVRQSEGRHYTPEPLVNALWDEVAALSIPSFGATVDPACGTGALLLPRLRQLIDSGDTPEILLLRSGQLVSGTDLDPLAVWLGNALLCSELLPLWSQVRPRSRGLLPQFLRVGDGLAKTDDQPGTIVMNPPYGRIQLSPGKRLRWERSLYGHSNRYALFVHAAIERAARGGIIAAVLPASFLGGNYYQRLRSMIAHDAPLRRLVFVDERTHVFAGKVLQETCLAIFQKTAGPHKVICSRLALNGKVHQERLPECPVPVARDGKPWLLPRGVDDGPLIRRAARLTNRLEDFGWKVSTGPLVWNRHKPQIGGSPVDAAPILWAADLLGGTIHRDSSRDHQRWIRLRERDTFMLMRSPAVLVQRTTAPEQPRRLVASLFDANVLEEWGGAVVVENHVNVLRCVRSSSVLTPTLLVSLLNSSAFDRLYRCLSGSVAVSAYELEALPLPDADTLQKWKLVSSDELDQRVQEFFEHGTA